LCEFVWIECDGSAVGKLPFGEYKPILMDAVMKDDVVYIFIDVKIMLYHGVGVLSVCASFYLHRSALTFLVDD
jgi:hypothetical protein